MSGCCCKSSFIVADSACSYFRLPSLRRVAPKLAFSASKAGLMRGINGAKCIGLTRHKINDRWRERAWLLVGRKSHRKLERGAPSGSLHRLVRPCPREIWQKAIANETKTYSAPARVEHDRKTIHSPTIDGISQIPLPLRNVATDGKVAR